MNTPPTPPPGEPLPISVVIPTFNREDLIARAVASALNQVPNPPAEVIVVDDCSTDDSAAVAEAAGARVIRRVTNGGEGPARNTGIEGAEYAWIGLLDSDDEWLPQLLATLWPRIADHSVVTGGYVVCDETGAYAGLNGIFRRRPVVVDNPRQLIYPENFFAASGTLVDRDAVLAAGGFRDLKGGADLDMWLRVIERGTGLAVPDPVVRYHIHSGQVTKNVDLMWKAHRDLVSQYADRPWWDDHRFEMWEGVEAYYRTLRKLASHDVAGVIRGARDIVRSPFRLIGAAGLILRRFRLRRRSAMTDEWGRESVALLAKNPTAGEPASDLRLLDLSDRSLLSSLLLLARRPTHSAVVSSRWTGCLVRLVGVDETTVARRPGK